MENNRKVSAVVISYQGMRFIPDCLKSLKADLADFRHEIIVIDNHSSDGTIEYIEKQHPEIKLIKNSSNYGFAKAVNQGIDAAEYEYVWLLNQDIRIRPGCLKALLESASALDQPGVIGPRLVGFDGTLQKFCRRFPRYRSVFFETLGFSYLFSKSEFFNGWKMGEFNHLQSRPVDQPMGAAMLITKSCLDRVGKFDESFEIFFNDVDFCHRAVEAGHINYYCADAVIEHYGGGSISQQKPKMVWLSHRAMYRYFRKWEMRRKSPFFIRLLRSPMLHLTGFFLLLSAIPRSLYHAIKSST